MWFLEPKAWHLLEKVSQQRSASLSALDNTPNSTDLEILSIDSDGIASIQISGILTKSADFIAKIFGGGNTTYDDINTAIELVLSNDDINSIDFLIDSPGGESSGLFETIDNIYQMEKPTRAILSGMAASAAYGLASATDSIIATSQHNEIGSIGVLMQFDSANTRENLVNTESPNKAPDPKTPPGRSILQKDIDLTYDRFVNLISRGRKTTSALVNKNFGKGSVFYADVALQRGMIDAIIENDRKNSTDMRLQSSEDTTTMSNTKLAASEMPTTESATADAHFTTPVTTPKKSYEDGVDVGIQQERMRVQEHLKAAKLSGSTQIAFAAIDAGTGMSSTTIMEYMLATQKNTLVESRAVDASATPMLDQTGVAAETTEDDFYSQLMSRSLKQMGIKEVGNVKY